MVKHSFRHLRRAFTMIELIFAIVIIGIVAITIPTILISNSRHVETNLLHEAILIAATKMGQNLSYPWDDNSTNPGTLAKTEVLDTLNGDPELDRNITDFRRGHFTEALHRRMSPASAPRAVTTVLGSESNDIDDIDDMVSFVPVLDDNDEFGYKHTYRIRTTANYVSDAATYSNPVINDFDFDPATAGVAVPTNIKMIEILVDEQNTTGAYNNVMLFRAFSSNIGETDYYKRTY